MRSVAAGDCFRGWLKVCCDTPWENTTAYQIRHFGCPYDPKMWPDRIPTVAKRQSFSRSIRRLTEEGLLVPIARWGTRTSHVRSTRDGLNAAVRLIDPADIDLEAIGIALHTTKWATAEHFSVTEAE